MIDQKSNLLSKLSESALLSSSSRMRRLLNQPIRSLVPMSLRLLRSTRVVSTRTFWGAKIEVVLPEPVSSMIFRFGYYDESVCRFLIATLRPGDTFFDVGAHFGLFSLLANELVGPGGDIVAFEPMPVTRERLKRNLDSQSGTGSVVVLDVAAFDRECELTFHDHGEAHSSFNSAFDARGLKGEGKPVVVKARPIDSVFRTLSTRKVDVIKIDAESAEMNVLRGAEQTIEQHRPILIAELGDFNVEGAPLSREIIDWLIARRYHPIECLGAEFALHRPQQHYGYLNLMFVPDERIDRINVSDAK